MMGHREAKKGYDEWDAFTSWRRYVRWRRGGLRKVKRLFSRRVRKEAKQAVERDLS